MSDDRGQLLLVTGFAIAASIVALVLLLNTAIYTENLATRGIDTGASDALAHRDTVEDDLWGMVGPAARNDDNETSRSAVESDVRERIQRFENLSSRHSLAAGASTNVGVVTFHNGSRLRQTDSTRNLTSASPAASDDWTMAENVSDVQRLELNTTGGLQPTTDPANESFRVDVRGDSNRWSLYVYDDGGPTLAVKNGSDPSGDIETDVCSEFVSDAPRVGLRAGTVNGVDCEALVFAKGASSPYEIAITYGNRSLGTYDAIVNGSAVETNLNDSAPLDSPYWVPAVYGFDAEVTYQSATLTYRSQVAISADPATGGGVLRFVAAPGEEVGNDDNEGTLEFDIENTADEEVTVERFSVDATSIDDGITIDDANAAELEIRTDVADGQADRDGAGEFAADGTTYDLVTDSDGNGAYATIGAGTETTSVDIRYFNQELGPFEVTYDEGEADLTVTFVLSDGREEVFYFHER